jgi:hypothetical protein
MRRARIPAPRGPKLQAGSVSPGNVKESRREIELVPDDEA